MVLKIWYDTALSFRRKGSIGMPNTKSAIKCMHTSNVKRLKNKADKSALRTVLKRTYAAIDAKRVEDARELLTAAFSALDRAVKKHIIHKNNAARKWVMGSPKYQKRQPSSYLGEKTTCPKAKD